MKQQSLEEFNESVTHYSSQRDHEKVKDLIEKNLHSWGKKSFLLNKKNTDFLVGVS